MTYDKKMDDRSWPRLCENSNSEIQSGKSKPIHGISINYVEFMDLIKRYARTFIRCYPNISEHQIVFTQPRPIAAIGGGRNLPNPMTAFCREAELRFLFLRIAES